MTTTTATIEAPAAEKYRTDAPVLEIPLTLAIQSAAAMLTSASKDDVTPILTAAHFDGEHLFATDRYKVARFPIPPRPAAEDDRHVIGSAFLIPREALEWVAKIVASKLRHFRTPLATMTDAGYTIRYESDPDTLTVTAAVVDMNGKTERSQAFDSVTGNFPPVARLFPGDDATIAADTQAFNPEYMGLILAYCKKYGNGAPFKITLYSTPGNKLAPALIEGAGASFLLQPNLILR